MLRVRTREVAILLDRVGQMLPSLLQVLLDPDGLHNASALGDCLHRTLAVVDLTYQQKQAFPSAQ